MAVCRRTKRPKERNPLRERCLLLLLTLIHSSPTSSNPYNTVFRSLTDEDDTTTKDDCVRVSFKKIYQALTVRTRMRLPQGRAFDVCCARARSARI